MAISSIGNGLSQPPGIAAGLSVYPRIAGAASGLIGFMQMIIAALGAFLVGQLPGDTPLPMVAVVGAAMIMALVFGTLALRAPGEATRPAPAVQLRPEIVRRP
jgi:DHA1 family bicyclomycin/chloramphenicol resistance-like MFS transporter